MTTADYWRKRDRQNATRIYDYATRQGALVTRWFGRAAREMEESIQRFTRKYAADNRLTLREARAELADRSVLEELQEHYQALLAVAPSDPVIDGWLTRLHTAKQINREEYLKAQLDLICSEVFSRYDAATGQTLNQLFEECYYKSLFDQQQLVGFGSSFNRLSVHQIQAATNTAWSGKNYSQAIWGTHRTALARYVDRIVTTGFIEGKSNQMMRAELQKATSASAYNARRLIRTECSYVASQGSLLGYREFGTQQYEFLATLDYRTSPICRRMDGKVFLVSEAKAGVNLPPLHPFCRSTTVPHVPDEAFDADATRTARDGKGNTYQVPAALTYRDWYAQHVQPDREEALAEQRYKAGRTDAAQWERYQARLGEDAPKSLAEFQRIKYTGGDDYDALKQRYRKAGTDRTALTYDEQAALTRYISGSSYALNAALRDGLPLTQEQQLLMAQLDAALDKMPVYEGNVIRSLKMKYGDIKAVRTFAEKHRIGSIVPYPAFTSASVLEGYHENPTFLLHIHSHTGRDVRSFNDAEGEILFRRNTHFKVLSATFENHTFLLEMEEVTE